MRKIIWLSVLSLIISHNSEAQWELLNYDTLSVLHSAHFFDECEGVICGFKNSNAENMGFIAKTYDCGLSWDTTYWSESKLYDMHFPTQDVGYACGFGTTILKTVDGGESWVDLQVSNDPQIDWWHHLTTIHFLDENKGYSSKADGFSIFLETLDGGNSWTKSELVDGCRNVVFDNFNEGRLVSGAGGRVTDDGGETWTVDHVGVSSRGYFAGDLFNGLDKQVLGGFGWDGVELFFNYATLAQTDDGGQSWTSRDILEMQLINDIAYINESEIIAVGKDFFDSYNIIKTVDGGLTWGWQAIEDPSAELVNTIISIAFASDSVWYAVGSFGSIWKTTNAGGPINYEWPYSDIGVLSIEEDLPSIKFQVFPNPSQTTINIQSSESISSIRLFDVLGKELLQQSSLNTSNAQLDVSLLPTGMYQLEVDFGEEKLYRKILVE